MKPSEMRDKDPSELTELEGQLQDQLLKISVAQSTQRHRNTSQISRIKRDIARVKTIQTERTRKETQA